MFGLFSRCYLGNKSTAAAMDQSTTKKSRQAKVSNMYSALVHAALVLEKKYHSAHLTKRRQV